MVPVFQEALGDAEDVGDELLAVLDGITVDALTDQERYPPERQRELLRRTLERLGLPA